MPVLIMPSKKLGIYGSGPTLPLSRTSPAPGDTMRPQLCLRDSTACDNFPIRMSLGQPLSKWRCQHGRMNRNESLRKTARVKRSNEQIGPEATQRADLEGFAAASGKMFSDLGGAPPCMARFRSHCAKPLRTRIPTAGPVVISFEQALR